MKKSNKRVISLLEMKMARWKKFLTSLWDLYNLYNSQRVFHIKSHVENQTLIHGIFYCLCLKKTY